MKSNILSLLAFTFLFSGFAAGQVCTVQKAKPWRGLEIGMTQEAFLAKFPGAPDRTRFIKSDLEAYPEFAGISSLFYRISSGKLDMIQVSFGGTMREDIKVLAPKVASELGLPKEAIVYASQYVADIKCPTLTLNVNAAEDMFTFADLETDLRWQKYREGKGPRP